MLKIDFLVVDEKMIIHDHFAQKVKTSIDS